MSILSKLKTKLRKGLSSQEEVKFVALTGNAAGVVKADEQNNIYITLHNGTPVTVYNEEVPLIAGRLVVVGFRTSQRKRLEVLRYVDAYPQQRTLNIPNHADDFHQWPNVDTLWVRTEQILSGIAIPDTELTVQFVGFVYYLNGWHLLDTQPLDLTALVPMSGALFVLVVVNSAKVISFVSGTVVATRELLEYSHIPLVPIGYKPLFAVKLYFGQTRILKELSETDIIDLRWAGYASGGEATTVDWTSITNKPDTAPIDDSVYAMSNDIWTRIDEKIALATEDLSAQCTGSEDHFDLAAHADLVYVYLNGVRQKQSDITMDTDGLGFTLGFFPLAGAHFIAEYPATPIYDEDMYWLVDDDGYLITEE